MKTIEIRVTRERLSDDTQNYLASSEYKHYIDHVFLFDRLYKPYDFFIRYKLSIYIATPFLTDLRTFASSRASRIKVQCSKCLV